MIKKKLFQSSAAVLLAAAMAFTAVPVQAAGSAETSVSTEESGDADTAGTEETGGGAGEGSGETGAAPSADVGEAVDSTGVVQLSREEALAQATYAEDQEEILGHKRIASKGNYEMYLKEDTLSVIIRNKTTGAIMESTVQDNDGKSNAAWQGFMQSGIALELQEDVNTQQPKLDLVSSGAEINVQTSADGFTADVTYPTQKISLQLQVTLNDDGSFTAKIPDDSIVEESETSKIGNIYVYPFLGYTYLGEREGYMLVPDGNGALIDLEDKDGRFSMAYSQKVFGSDVGMDASYVLSLFWDEYQTVNDGENIMAPVYGMVHTDSRMAYLAVIESGAEQATIEAYPNGAYTNYNWISAKFMKHTVYTQPTSNSGGSVVRVTDKVPYDIQIRYNFVEGDEADYAGLAKSYRNYLIDNGMLQATDEGFKIRLDFLGTDRENWLLFKRAVTMTTAEQVSQIYEELAADGVTDILTLYKGWQDGGVYSLPVSSYDADSEIGGNRKLTSLMEDAEAMGIELYLYSDGLRANPDTGNTTFNVIKKLDKRQYEEETYKDVYDTMKYLTPDRSKTLLNSLVKDMNKNGAGRLALGGVGNTLFTWTYSGASYTRSDTAKTYGETFEELSQNTELILNEPFSIYWDYTKAVTDMPVEDSDYIFMDESVPFLSIVLKGVMPMYADYTNFEADKQEFFLKLVETGVYPSFYLTWEDPSDLLYTNSNDLYTSQYSVYKEEVEQYYKELKAVSDQVQGATIEEHEKDGDLSIVTYSNGIRVYVNYGEADAQADGLTIPALSYKVGDAQ